MNKIKIMLMGVATFAIIGGSLAFKTAKFNARFCINSLTYTLFSPPTSVPVPFTGKSTITGNALYPVSFYYTLTFNISNCSMVTQLISFKEYINNIE